MDKKNTVIVILVLILVAFFYFDFQNKERTGTGSEKINSPDVDPILPSRTLKAAFEESSQHSAMADIAELSCFPTSRYDCGLEGCMPASPASYYFVDYGLESGTYFRCDAKGCDHYPVKVVTSGSFTQFIPILGQAMLFKVSMDESLGNKGQFIDIATLGVGAVMSFGKCKVIKK